MHTVRLTASPNTIGRFLPLPTPQLVRAGASRTVKLSEQELLALQEHVGKTPNCYRITVLDPVRRPEPKPAPKSSRAKRSRAKKAEAAAPAEG